MPKRTSSTAQNVHPAAKALLWIAGVVFVAATIIGILAIVDHYDVLSTVIEFGIAMVGLLLAWLSATSNTIRAYLRQSWRTGLSIACVCVLLVSLTFNILLVSNQGKLPFLPNADPVYVEPSSSPGYAQVSIGWSSNSLSVSNQETHIKLDFKNDGRNDCADIKVATIYLTNLTGRDITPSSPLGKPWRLSQGGTILQRSFTFPIVLMKGSQYPLTLVLDVGGCAVPHDSSNSRLASYRVLVPG